MTPLQQIALLTSLLFSSLVSFNLPSSQLALLLAPHLKQEWLSLQSLKGSRSSTAAFRGRGGAEKGCEICKQHLINVCMILTNT